MPGPLGNAGWAPGRAQEPREGMCTGHCHAHPCSPTPRHKHLHLSSSQLTFWVEALPASSFLSCKDVGSPSLSSQMKGGGNMHHFPNQVLAKKKRKKKFIKKAQVCLPGLAHSAAGRKRVPHIYWEHWKAPSFQWKVTRWPQIFLCSPGSLGFPHPAA